MKGGGNELRPACKPDPFGICFPCPLLDRVEKVTYTLFVYLGGAGVSGWPGVQSPCR